MSMYKLDYSLATPEERLELVNTILSDPCTPTPTTRYLEILADYLILPIEKKERREKKILTDNRMATVNKRETSFEGLVSQMENGEDGIYSIITDNKHTIFQHKVTISDKDLDNIPALKQLRESIIEWEAKLPFAQGKDAYTIKKALIEMRKEQYIIKNAYNKPIAINSPVTGVSLGNLGERVWLNEAEEVCYEGMSLINPNVVMEFLCLYSKLKQESYGNYLNDLWYMFSDFERYCDIALRDYPIYEKIVECKIDGAQNSQIKDILQEEFGTTHSSEYISNLWRNKIPKMIASVAEEEWLLSHFLTQEKGKWKKCSRCKEVKLAHNKYFSKNKTSKDGYYSICKCCRNSK